MDNQPRPAAQNRHDTVAPASLRGLLGVVRARWLWVVAGALLALAVAVLWLRAAEYRHHVELRVSASPGGGSHSTSLGGLASLAAIAGVGTTVEATPFRLYLEDITSPAAAAAAAADLTRDDALLRRVLGKEWTGKDWQPPRTAANALSEAMLGVPDKPPGGWRIGVARLAGELGERGAKRTQPGGGSCCRPCRSRGRQSAALAAAPAG